MIRKGLIDIFDQQPTVCVNWEDYVINPLTDHQPFTTYEMLETVIEWFLKVSDISNTTKILWEEDRWGFIASLISYKTKIPFWLVKWNPCWYDWDIHVDFRNMYTSWKMYLNWIQKWDKVIIIEDMVDSWGTIISMIKLLEKYEVEIIDIFSISIKEWLNWYERIYKETGYKVNWLCKFKVEDWKSKITTFNPLI